MLLRKQCGGHVSISLSLFHSINQVLNAAGLPNEYNTATFIQYNSIIGVVSVWRMISCILFCHLLRVEQFDKHHTEFTYFTFPLFHTQGSAFMTFFDDPSIQELIHVRGFDLPGINFEIEGMAVTK